MASHTRKNYSYKIYLSVAGQDSLFCEMCLVFASDLINAYSKQRGLTALSHSDKSIVKFSGKFLAWTIL